MSAAPSTTQAKAFCMSRATSRGRVRTRIRPIRRCRALFAAAALNRGGGFTSMGRGIGLEGRGGGTWRAADVGSPFDYASQGILYVARHLPRPGEDPD